MKNLELNKDSKSELQKYVFHGSDWFYLPRKKFEMFHYLNMNFRKVYTFLESAVPFLLAGLNPYKLSRLKNVNEAINFCNYFLHEKYNN